MFYHRLQPVGALGPNVTIPGTKELDLKQRWQIDSFTLKIIAIVGMTADHIGNVFWNQLPLVARCLLFAPGGLTFPIMAYLLTVGYQHTRDVRKYALRLGLFALISLLPFFWALELRLNVLFTLLLGLLVIWAYDKLKNRLLFLLIFLVATGVTYWCDWSFIGVPMILLYHLARQQRSRLWWPVALVWLMGGVYVLQLLSLNASPALWLNWLPNLFYCFVGASATIPLVYWYNGQRGRPLKYFFYGYYPVHLTILALVRGLFWGIWW